MNKIKRCIIGILSIILLVGFDQYTKYLAIIKLKNKKPFVIIDGVLQFNYLENRGAAWGILNGKKVLFVISTTIIVAFLIYFFVKLPTKRRYNPLKVMTVILIAGAIGTLIDRIRLDYVVDFIYFNLINCPIFNIADCYVTISLIALIIAYSFVYTDDDFDFVKKKKKNPYKLPKM